MRYGIVALPRWCGGALAVALVCLLALAGRARAETYLASNTAQLVEAVGKANANLGANTIKLAGATYLPTATLTFTNTTGVQTVEGPTTLPAARVDGGQVEPLGSELFALKASVAVTFKNVDETSGGGSGVAPSIDDFGAPVVGKSTPVGKHGQSRKVGGRATTAKALGSRGGQPRPCAIRPSPTALTSAWSTAAPRASSTRPSASINSASKT